MVGRLFHPRVGWWDYGQRRLSKRGEPSEWDWVSHDSVDGGVGPWQHLVLQLHSGLGYSFATLMVCLRYPGWPATLSLLSCRTLSRQITIPYNRSYP